MASTIDADNLVEAVLEAAFEVFQGRRIRFAEDSSREVVSGAELVAGFRRAGVIPILARSGVRVLTPPAAIRATEVMLIERGAVRPGSAAPAATRLCSHLALRDVVLTSLGDHDDLIVLHNTGEYRRLMGVFAPATGAFVGAVTAS